MAAETIAINIPQSLYQRLMRLTQLTNQPVDHVVVQTLNDFVPPMLDDFPENMRRHLVKLEAYPFEQLWQVPISTFDAELHQEYMDLLHKERRETLPPTEKERLETLFESANRHMLQKAYANVLLKWRNHALPSLNEPVPVQ